MPNRYTVEESASLTGKTLPGRSHPSTRVFPSPQESHINDESGSTSPQWLHRVLLLRALWQTSPAFSGLLSYAEMVWELEGLRVLDLHFGGVDEVNTPPEELQQPYGGPSSRCSTTTATAGWIWRRPGKRRRRCCWRWPMGCVSCWCRWCWKKEASQDGRHRRTPKRFLHGFTDITRRDEYNFCRVGLERNPSACATRQAEGKPFHNPAATWRFTDHVEAPSAGSPRQLSPPPSPSYSSRPSSSPSLASPPGTSGRLHDFVFFLRDSLSWFPFVLEALPRAAAMGALLMASRYAAAAAASRGDIFSNETDRSLVVSICIFVAVLCFCIVTGHLLEENRWLDQSITAMIIVSCGRWEGGSFSLEDSLYLGSSIACVRRILASKRGERSGSSRFCYSEGKTLSNTAPKLRRRLVTFWTCWTRTHKRQRPILFHFYDSFSEQIT